MFLGAALARRRMRVCLLLLLCSAPVMSARAAADAALRIVYITVPSMEVGKSIAHSVVRQKLAACANIVPGVVSVYEWQDKIHEDGELLVILKTRAERVRALEEEVKRLHPYDTMAFVTLNVEEAHEPYAKWVREQTEQQGEKEQEEK